MEVEKRKNTSDLYKNQLRKMEKDIKKKDKDIEEYRKLVEQLKNKMYEFVNTQQPQSGKPQGNQGSFVSSLGDESVSNSAKPQKKGLNNTMGSKKDLG